MKRSTALYCCAMFAASFIAFTISQAAPLLPPPDPAPPRAPAPVEAKRTVEPGVCFDGRIVSVHDGDTLTFVVMTEYQVRLRDCWAPELRDAKGPEAGDALRDLAVGKPARLFIPFNRTGKFGDEMSFGRVVGDVWTLDDPVDLGTQMVRKGIATRERPKHLKEDQ